MFNPFKKKENIKAEISNQPQEYSDGCDDCPRDYPDIFRLMRICGEGGPETEEIFVIDFDEDLELGDVYLWENSCWIADAMVFPGTFQIGFDIPAFIFLETAVLDCDCPGYNCGP